MEFAVTQLVLTPFVPLRLTQACGELGRGRVARADAALRGADRVAARLGLARAMIIQ